MSTRPDRIVVLPAQLANWSMPLPWMFDRPASTSRPQSISSGSWECQPESVGAQHRQSGMDRGRSSYVVTAPWVRPDHRTGPGGVVAVTGPSAATPPGVARLLGGADVG